MEESSHHPAEKLSAHSLILTRQESRLKFFREGKKRVEKCFTSKKNACRLQRVFNWRESYQHGKMGDERFLQFMNRPPVGLWIWQNTELNFQGCFSPPSANWSENRKRGICYSQSLCPSRWWRRTEYEWGGRGEREKNTHFRRWKQDLKGNWCNITDSGMNTGWTRIKNAG